MITRIHVFCEGQTEDVFVRELLLPYFARKNILLNPIIIRTSAHGKGGVISYGKIRWQVDKKCKEDPHAWVTTLLDYYGLPTDFPAMDSVGCSTDRAKAVEKAFQDDIAQRNFIANLVVHEFEGLLFSSPDAFRNWFSSPDVVISLKAVKNGFKTPEDINDGKTTAPSKRILNICKGYNKILHGSLIAQDIGLDIIRQECPLFDGWIKKLESLASTGGAS